MMKYFQIFVLIIILFYSVATLSQAPCQPNSKSYFYEIEHYQKYPPINKDMPIDIQIGYRVADSICRNTRPTHLNDFMNRKNNSDSILYFMKYFYLMSDYNPLMLEQYSMYSDSTSMPADFIIDDLNKRVEQTMPLSTQLLMHAYYILHIRVNKTIIVNGVNGVLCKDLTVVPSNILDKIKGQIIPKISKNASNYVSEADLGIDTNTENLIFNFCNQWERSNQELLNDGQGSEWLKPNSEYIVFLYPRMICNDSNNFYVTIFPSGKKSLSHGMYPIINGNVQDIGNDFGLGKSVPIKLFKQNLIKLIDSIRYYGN